MFKKKLLLGIIPLIGIAAVGAIAATPVNDTVEVPAVAEEAEPVTNEGEANALVSIVVYNVTRDGGKRNFKIYENENINSQKDVDEAMDLIRQRIKNTESFGNVYTSETNITFLADCSLYFRSLDLGRFIINLKGHTWTINTKRSWKIHEHFTINGENGTITTDRSQSGTFEFSGNGEIVLVNDTKFKNFKCGRYPIFQIEGKQRKNIWPQLILKHCEFENCKSSRYGGVFYVYNVCVCWVENCKFYGCKSKYGGVGYVDKSGGDLKIYSNTFENCSAKEGGVMYFESNAKDDGKDKSYIVNLNYNSINSCTAKYGGFVYVHSTNVTFLCVQTKVNGCSAKEGGSIYIDKEYVTWTSIEISNSKADYGGAFYIHDEYASIISSSFKSCRANKKGNVFYSKYDFNERENTFIDCNQPSDDGAGLITIIEENNTQSETALSQTPIWIMGSLILAVIIGSTVTICLVFRKKKE